MRETRTKRETPMNSHDYSNQGFSDYRAPEWPPAGAPEVPPGAFLLKPGMTLRATNLWMSTKKGISWRPVPAEAVGTKFVSAHYKREGVWFCQPRTCPIVLTVEPGMIRTPVVTRVAKAVRKFVTLTLGDRP